MTLKEKLDAINKKITEKRSEISSAETPETVETLGSELSTLEAEKDQIIIDAELEIVSKKEAEVTAEADAQAEAQADIDAKTKELNEKEIELEAEARSLKVISSDLNPLDTYGKQEKRKIGGSKMNEELRKVIEQKGLELRNGKSVVFTPEELGALEERSITIASSNILTPTYSSNELNPTFNEVSGFIDKVKVVTLNGGETYQSAFEKTFGEGDYTDENTDYHTADPTNDYVNIKKTNITSYSEISKQAVTLSTIDYTANVIKNMKISLRKKLTKELVIGDGEEGHLTGIYHAPTNVMPSASCDIEIDEIDNNTLSDIVFAYGGDEDLEGGATLILNKDDLKEFNKLRLTNGEKSYIIKINPDQNGGTIEERSGVQVPFVINSAITPFSTATAGANCMIYGKTMAYEMAQFGAMTVEESRDFNFKKGMISYRADVQMGGNVASYKGFIRVKKATTPSA